MQDSERPEVLDRERAGMLQHLRHQGGERVHHCPGAGEQLNFQPIKGLMVLKRVA